MFFQLPSTTETKTNLDFKPVYSASRQRSEEQHLDFTCPIPSANALNSQSDVDGFVPSMSMSGTTYVTRVTAIRDRHLVEGACEVVYSLEAEFLRSGTNQLVRRISCPVDVSSELTPLEVEVNSLGSSDQVERVAKPQSRSLNRFIPSPSQPELTVSMPKMLGSIISDSSRLATGCRRFTIPVSVNVALPRRLASSISETNTLKCSVKAQWYTKRTFTTGPSAVESTVRSDRASTQKFALALPPLYQDENDRSKYSTSMELDLLLPGSISTPSISTNLLSVSYSLDLSMDLELNGNGASKTPYTVNFTLPVTLRSAHPESIISRRTFDPLLGMIQEEALYAPPPYVY